MAENFRSLQIWQEANALTLKIYRASKQFPGDERFSLTDQLRRAANSVGANIAEGCGRYGEKDKIHFMMIARGSIFETRSHLSISLGLSYINNENFTILDNRYEALTKRLNAFISSLKPSTN